MAVYTVEKKNGTSVAIGYTPTGEARVREVIEFVSHGTTYAKRLRDAKKRAEQVLVKRRAAIVEGKHELARPRHSMTLARFVETIYADELRGRGIRTAEKEISRLTSGPLGRYFGSTPLSDITKFRIQGYMKARREGRVGREGVGGRTKVGPGALNRDFSRLSNLWNVAREKGLVWGDNPCRQLGRLEEPEGRTRFLTPDEAERLLAALVEPGVRRLVEVGLHTGIRLKALLHLRWSHVEFALGQLRIPKELDKAKKGYRVAMNPRVEEVLHELPRHSECVFAKADGSPRKSIRTTLRTACRRAGIEDFTFHVLRHTTASRIVMSGGTLYDAGQQLGHRTPAMTQRYAHLSQDHMQEVAARTMVKPPARVVQLSEAREAR